MSDGKDDFIDVILNSFKKLKLDNGEILDKGIPINGFYDFISMIANNRGDFNFLLRSIKFF